MTIDEILEVAVNRYGEREQSAMAMEECGELIRAINKMHRDPSIKHHNALIGEIADVLIMIEQLKIIYGIPPADIERMRAWKITRLAKRLKNESEENKSEAERIKPNVQQDHHNGSYM